MKHIICRRSISVATFFVIVVFLTMGVRAEEKECIDVSGTWTATEEINNSDCGVPNSTEHYTYQLIQKDCTVICKRGQKEDPPAKVVGNQIYWPEHKKPGRQAGTTIVLEAAVSLVNGNKATGKRHWTATRGTKTCAGSIEQTILPS